ncbi:MAG: PilZ domain-containing protein [Nitrospiraceae bacterium]|nr:MAG: PilZ domain-containing protein [Nitrospiraceae bacterium]
MPSIIWPMDIQSERREYKRYPFTENILIDGVKSCQSTDISEGGLFVSAIQHFEKNDLIDFTISFKNWTVMINGQIRYYQYGIGMGIMFIDLTEDQKAQIKKIIEAIPATS